jgi:hypothetical protein
MPDLRFEVTGVEVVRFAVSPQLAFKLRIRQAQSPVEIQSIALQCQVRIEPARRRYETGERDKLLDLFGTPDRWGQTLLPLLWTHASAAVGPFEDSTEVDMPVPCTFDFNVAATKYFAALEDGEIPLTLLFSGTIFYRGEIGLQVAQIPWDREANFRLPVGVWKDMMEVYYPNSAWLCLRRDVFDPLSQYKSQRGLPTWEQALESLLPEKP